VDLAVDDVAQYSIGAETQMRDGGEGTVLAIVPANGSCSPSHTGKGIVVVQRAALVEDWDEILVSETSARTGWLCAIARQVLVLLLLLRQYGHLAVRMLKHAAKAQTVRTVMLNKHLLGRVCVMLAYMISLISAATHACSNPGSDGCAIISNATLGIGSLTVIAPTLVTLHDKFFARATSEEDDGGHLSSTE
jgi:hypothetical protein